MQEQDWQRDMGTAGATGSCVGATRSHSKLQETWEATDRQVGQKRKLSWGRGKLGALVSLLNSGG